MSAPRIDPTAGTPPQRKTGDNVTVTVSEGDNLWDLTGSQYAGLSDADRIVAIALIAEMNGLDNPNLIQPGRQLLFPRQIRQAIAEYKKSHTAAQIEEFAFRLNMDAQIRAGFTGVSPVRPGLNNAPPEPPQTGPRPPGFPVPNTDL